MREPARWLPTQAHLRALTIAAGCVLIAVLVRRTDVIVLGVPFIGAAAWGAHHRPRVAPGVELALADATVFEGQVTTTTVTVGASGGETGDVVAVCLDGGTAVGWRPRVGAAAASSEGGPIAIPVATRAVRWGRHPIELTGAACTSRLGAFRTAGLTYPPVTLTTLPLSSEFDAGDAVPRPAGLVGLHRANRQGGGSEPAEVRQFRPGDRLRRINWRVSSRTGTLHVTSTWSDRDTHVLLLLDTEADIGRSDGIDGRASSLDIAVRGAAAVADHFCAPVTGSGSSTSAAASATCPSAPGSGTCVGCSTRWSWPSRPPTTGPTRCSCARRPPVRSSWCSRRSSGRPGSVRSPTWCSVGRPSWSSTRCHRSAIRPSTSGTRWPHGSGRWNAGPRSIIWVSSACPSSHGAAAARSTRSSATSVAWPWLRGTDDERGGPMSEWVQLVRATLPRLGRAPTALAAPCC